MYKSFSVMGPLRRLRPFTSVISFYRPQIAHGFFEQFASSHWFTSAEMWPEECLQPYRFLPIYCYLADRLSGWLYRCCSVSLSSIDCGTSESGDMSVSQVVLAGISSNMNLVEIIDEKGSRLHWL